MNSNRALLRGSSRSDPTTGGRKYLGTSPVTKSNNNANTFSSLGDTSKVPENKQNKLEPARPPQRLPSELTNEEEEDTFRWNHPLILLLLIFICFTALLFLVYHTFPEMKDEEKKHLKIPWNMKDAKALAKVLDRYKEDHFWTVLTGFALFYVFLQSFAIPGSIFLSIMSGFLFPFWTALSLVCFCSSTGASSCYLLSWLVARKLVRKNFRQEINHWTERVNEQGESLLNFIIFLRITPILPNWVINVVAPHIGVPLGTFWIGTFLGVAPPSALAVQAGSALNAMATPTDYISWNSILLLAICSLAALIPVMVRRQ